MRSSNPLWRTADALVFGLLIFAAMHVSNGRGSRISAWKVLRTFAVIGFVVWVCLHLRFTWR